MRFSEMQNKRGSALLVAILVTAVIISISLILSRLVFREQALTKSFLESGRAYYAAESAVEMALYELNTELPGWQTDGSIGLLGEKAGYRYSVKNQCNSYPCLDEDEYELGSIPTDKFYDVLDLNEAITIPLFTVGDDGKVVPVTDFAVEYFVAFNPATDLKLSLANLSGWDLLRWKVFGMTRHEGKLVTESIHDFTAVSTARNYNSGEEYVSNATEPSWFGTVKCDQMEDRQTDDISCISYVSGASTGGDLGCNNEEARDYFIYNGEDFIGKAECYPIEQFMESHAMVSDIQTDGATGLNYLSLTNLMNPSVLNPDRFPTEQSRQEASKIYFRVETFDKNTVREYADIVAEGYSGDSKQSIGVSIKRDSYMPVFNFSLYSTYGSDEFYIDEEEDPFNLDLPAKKGA